MKMTLSTNLIEVQYVTTNKAVILAVSIVIVSTLADKIPKQYWTESRTGCHLGNSLINSMFPAPVSIEEIRLQIHGLKILLQILMT